MVIVFIGPPGSGKDTQAQLLADQFAFTVISGGEALREEVQRQGPHALEIKTYMERGDLVPDDLAKPVLTDYIRRLGKKEKLAFTGSVRSFAQVGIIDDVLTDLGVKLDAVIYLDLPDELVFDRIEGRLYAPGSDRTYHLKYKPPKVPGVCDISGEPLVKRADDTPETVAERLRIYHAELPQILGAYRSRGILHTVDANKPIDDVQTEIQHMLKLV